jgi:hypothetical protein
MQSGEVNEGERQGEGRHGSPHRKDCFVPHPLRAEPIPLSGELAEVVAAWPKLPEAVRAGIVAMVRAAKGERTSS